MPTGPEALGESCTKRGEDCSVHKVVDKIWEARLLALCPWEKIKMCAEVLLFSRVHCSEKKGKLVKALSRRAACLSI